MASHCVRYAFSPLPQRKFSFRSSNHRTSSNAKRTLHISGVKNSGGPYNTLVSEAARLLGPPARFESSKLKVVFMGEELYRYSGILPRTYVLSHCDFTANLTLTISNIISLDQLKGWYKKDDVVAEWKMMKGNLCLIVHCYVGGPGLFLDVAAEFRYHIFSKELPLVLKAFLHGDPALSKEHPEILDALVWVYFHSRSPKYNRLECWGPLKDAAEGRRGDHLQGPLNADKDNCRSEKWESPKSILQALFTFLL